MAPTSQATGLEALVQAAEKPPRWKDCAAVYPPSEDIYKALQDVGKVVACKTKAGKLRGMKLTKCDQIQKIAAHVYRKIKDIYRPAGLTDNVSRGKHALVLDIVNYRKAFDTTDVRMEFHQHNSNGKVLLIANEVPYAGLDASVDRFQSRIQDSVRKKDAQRTPDDGMRCAAIMLDAKCRGTVCGIMSNKKDRNKSDIPGDHVENYFNDAVIDFLNPAYLVNQPNEENVREFPEEDRAAWDPNSATTLEHERDGKWLMDTWFQHVKPKYRHALNKRNKDTGGGSGEVHEFINYCNHDRWLAWIFALDYEASFLLAASTCGQMPARLQMESGWDDLVSELDGPDEDGKSRAGSSAASAAKSDKSSTVNRQEKNLSDLNQLIGQLVQNQSAATKCPDAPENPSFHFCMERAAYYREEIKQVAEDSTLTPDTKGVTLRMLGRKKKRLYKLAEEAELKRYKRSEEEGDDESV